MLTQDRLKEVFHFDREMGRFFWKIKVRSRKIGQMAGSYDAHGYGQINFDGKIYKEHHLVWLWEHGDFPTGQLDHINHDRRDNRPENLRAADNMENHKNRPMQKNNKTGCVGVWYDPRGFYYSYINVNGKRIGLGNFKNIEDAISARRQANEKYGYHPNHGIGYGRSKSLKAQEQAKLARTKLKELKKKAIDNP